MTSMHKECQLSIERAANILEQADSLIIAAGAGMGVDSGLPDFRGTEGFWRAYPALKVARIDFARIASPKSFQENPRRGWGFYGHRLALYRNTIPHEGFHILKQWAANLDHGCSVFTSNVDGQFQKAGFDPLQIVECHGSIHYLQCIDNCQRSIWTTSDFAPIVDETTCELLSTPPVCYRCDSIARPNILMFNDWNWIEDRTEQQERRQQLYLSKVKRPLVIEIGAGTNIPSVRNFSHRIIHRHNGRLIRINPTDYKVPTPLDVGLKMGALEALRLIDAEMKAR